LSIPHPDDVTEVQCPPARSNGSHRAWLRLIASDEGDEIFLHASALPAGVTDPKPGTIGQFGVADGRRGPQALSVKLLDPIPSVVRATRRPVDDMVVIVEDLI